jgi:hypothetical protein
MHPAHQLGFRLVDRDMARHGVAPRGIAVSKARER